jgi:hypothetical protein
MFRPLFARYLTKFPAIIFCSTLVTATAPVGHFVQKNRGNTSGSTGGDSGDSGGTTGGTEKGRKRCNDGLDNDGAAFIDGADSDYQ